MRVLIQDSTVLGGATTALADSDHNQEGHRPHAGHQPTIDHRVQRNCRIYKESLNGKVTYSDNYSDNDNGDGHGRGDGRGNGGGGAQRAS